MGKKKALNGKNTLDGKTTFELDFAKRWLFFNCKRSEAWIIYRYLDDMLESYTEGEKPKAEDLRFVWASKMDPTRVITLIETKTGDFYLIDNKKILPTPKEEEKTENKTEIVEKTETGEKTGTVEKDMDTVEKNMDGNDEDNDEGIEDKSIKFSIEQVKEGDEDAKEKEKAKEAGVKIENKVYMFQTLEKCLMENGEWRELLDNLQIVKYKKMKLTKDENTIKILPYHYHGLNYEESISLLCEQVKISKNHLEHDLRKPSGVRKIKLDKNNKNNKTNGQEVNVVGNDLISSEEREVHLDLSHMFNITSTDLERLDVVLNERNDMSRIKIRQLTLNTNFRLVKFDWCKTKWAQDLMRVNVVNMSHFINASLDHMVSLLPKLTSLRVQMCQQVNIKCMKELLARTQLEELILFNNKMVCQPNAYSGLISEEEWDKIRDRKLKRLLINSENLTLDVIDYINRSCLGLEMLMIHPSVFKGLHNNIVNPGSQGKEDLVLQVVDLNTKKILVLGRNFLMKGLLRMNYQKPFSPQMEAIAKRILENDSESSESDSDN